MLDSLFFLIAAIGFMAAGFTLGTAWMNKLLSADRWRPMEEFPDDGTQCLVILTNGWYELLRYRRDKDFGGRYDWYVAQGRTSVPVVSTHGGYEYEWEKSGGILAVGWMPLPEAPKWMIEAQKQQKFMLEVFLERQRSQTDD